jgi:uncharacterized protein (TIGR02996 family)
MDLRRVAADQLGPDCWAIALERERVIVWSGKVGTGGKKQTHALASPADAQGKYRQLVAEKMVGGWTLPRVHREFHLGGRTPKFWTVTIAGRLRAVLSGRVGSDGKVSNRWFRTEAAALAECERLIARRIAEGYVEQKPAAGSLREALLDAIRSNPGDAASRNAFTDYLSEQGEQLSAAAYRVDANRWREGGFENLQRFLADPAVGLVQALVVGCCWLRHEGDPAPIVEALIAARDRLTSLRALFLGDVVRDEQEISWIRQSDVTDLLGAFPDLEHFRVRGGARLVLRPFEHRHLKSLVIEASNLSREVVRAVGASKLPSLEHLELWLGTEEYGADTTPGDLDGILQGDHLPALRYLGLRNSEIADDIAVAVAGAPIQERLRVLDLSLGTLTDRGAEDLLAIIPSLPHLEKLDIHHHYVSRPMVKRLRALGVPVDASEPQEAEDIGDEELYRFVAHSE